MINCCVYILIMSKDQYVIFVLFVNEIPYTPDAFLFKENWALDIGVGFKW